MICTKCKINKPEADFFKRKTAKGIQSHCKLCAKTWHKEVYRTSGHGKEMQNAASKRYNAKMRLELIAAYGGKCFCCGEDEPHFLSVDHIGGGGQKHRNEIGEGGHAIATFLRRNNYPTDKYRLLCYNCNCAIGFFGACPHSYRHTQTACAE